MDKERTAKIMRFASIAMREAQGEITPDNTAEKTRLLQELGVSAEEILELASQILIGGEK